MHSALNSRAQNFIFCPALHCTVLHWRVLHWLHTLTLHPSECTVLQLHLEYLHFLKILAKFHHLIICYLLCTYVETTKWNLTVCTELLFECVFIVVSDMYASFWDQTHFANVHRGLNTLRINHRGRSSQSSFKTLQSILAMEEAIQINDKAYMQVSLSSNVGQTYSPLISPNW